MSVRQTGGTASRRSGGRVELGVYTDNHAAIALYQKFGFEKEGVMRDYSIRDGQYADTLTQARLRR